MRDISNSREIQLFMHCGLCLKGNLPQQIEAGWTRQGFQVWCRTHQCNIIHVDFEGAQHPANMTRKGEPNPEPNPEPEKVN